MEFIEKKGKFFAIENGSEEELSENVYRYIKALEKKVEFFKSMPFNQALTRAIK